MKITVKSGELTMKEMYDLTKSPEIGRLRDLKDQDINLAQYVVYEDSTQDGETVLVMSLKTEEGELYSTNSQTFINDFLDIIEMCREAGEELPKCVKVHPVNSRNGREYLTCVYLA